MHVFTHRANLRQMQRLPPLPSMQSYGKFDRTSTSKVEHNWANVAFADGLLQISRYTGKSVFSSSVAYENIRFSSLFAAGDVSRGGTSATQRQRFHTDDENQCLRNKSGSHGVPNTNLSNFTCLLVDFGKLLCSSANELQKNSNASSREEYIPQILIVLLEILRVYIWPLWPFVFCLSFVNNNYNNVTTLSTNQRFYPDSL